MAVTRTHINARVRFTHTAGGSNTTFNGVISDMTPVQAVTLVQALQGIQSGLVDTVQHIAEWELAEA